MPVSGMMNSPAASQALFALQQLTNILVKEPCILTHSVYVSRVACQHFQSLGALQQLTNIVVNEPCILTTVSIGQELHANIFKP